MKTRSVYRSAITGRFISRADAEKHPDTTIRQIIYVKPPRPKED